MKEEVAKMSEIKNDSVLLMKDVTMQFGGVVAVNNLSLEVKRNQIVALIGPNGAGKTTAFNCITGVYEPSNGYIEFEGKKIVANHPRGKMKKLYAGQNGDAYTHLKTLDPTPDQITKLGIARTFQNIRLWKSMTVFDNVLTAKHMRAKHNFFTATFRLSAAEERRMREETAALLEEQDLLKYANDMATSLPYGLQRRLEIARALATEPKLLLLDEPAAGMNPQETLELGDYILQIKEKYDLTVFMIEHHMDLVMRFSDKIYVIDFGKLICEGTPEYVQSDKRVINAYLGVD
jgi:branched-chain amino acid transport system ATP-binding protein